MITRTINLESNFIPKEEQYRLSTTIEQGNKLEDLTIAISGEDGSWIELYIEEAEVLSKQLQAFVKKVKEEII
jgi:hypothetical protein